MKNPQPDTTFSCVNCGKEIDINKEGFQFHGSAAGGAKFRHYKSGCDLKRPGPFDSMEKTDIHGDPLIDPPPGRN